MVDGALVVTATNNCDSICRMFCATGLHVMVVLGCGVCCESENVNMLCATGPWCLQAKHLSLPGAVCGSKTSFPVCGCKVVPWDGTCMWAVHAGSSSQTLAL